ncbi:nicotinate phosphoribosyltransferase [Orbaceae bacterium ESL0721]|nr:nicotinate phosphoribosyltransferase [Orbaceae bacterium ESL0721]
MPIITSLLDTDAYKLHMQQAVFHHYPNTTVVAEFRCRNSDLLGKYADEIKQQVKLMETLTLTDDEFAYLKTIPFLKDDYLNWLKKWRYNSQLLTINSEEGQLTIRIAGRWLDVILWEVPLLALISEIVHKDRSPNLGEREAIAHLKYKLDNFAQKSRQGNIDLTEYHLMDFGTRRRYSFAVQEAVVTYLKEHAFKDYSINFHSTSNYLLAYRLGLNPAGTQAHEWFQAHQRLSDNLVDCQKNALQAWLKEYPDVLGIALTDCITMDAFLRDFDRNFATQYKGLRHDSGDPIAWGEKAIAHYKQLGIDPKSKLLVFSDSLTLDRSLAIYQHFYKRTQLSFGIGGSLACDIPALTVNTDPLNIVIKLVECNGQAVAKLSDSPGKTISQDKTFINQLRQAFAIKSA